MKDRVKELRRVRASELVPHALNWRKHPKRQRELLQNVLQTLGFADALLARETPDGRLVLIDGHLRADLSPNDEVPVLVLDLNEREANELLLLRDPIATLAERDDSAVETLLATFETSDETIREFVDETFRIDVDAEIADADDAGTGAAIDETSDRADAPPNARAVVVPELYQILVECRDEDEQRECFEELVEKGRKCRILNL